MRANFSFQFELAGYAFDFSFGELAEPEETQYEPQAQGSQAVIERSERDSLENGSVGFKRLGQPDGS